MNQYKTYSVSHVDISLAFQKAHFYMTEGSSYPGSKKKVYTIYAALNMATGHNLAVLWACRNIVREALEGKSCSQWLIENGVPEEEVRGKKGFYGIRIWKQLWLKKLADEFALKPCLNYNFQYPF